MTIQWSVPPDKAFEELAHEYGRAIHRAVVIICQKWTPQIANWMKANAPWTDRTGNARQALWSDVNDVVNVMVDLIISHGVDYGVYLELDHAGRYAVVGPALSHFSPKIWSDVSALFKR